jgi:hypothetical protein
MAAMAVRAAAAVAVATRRVQAGGLTLHVQSCGRPLDRCALAAAALLPGVCAYAVCVYVCVCVGAACRRRATVSCASTAGWTMSGRLTR